MSNRLTSIAIVLLLVSFGFVARLLPHPPNLAPVAAIALFAGFLFGARIRTIALPLASVFLSDMLLGSYDYRVMVVVYAGLSLPVFMAWFLRNTASLPTILMTTAASSSIFFFITNFAVWYFGTLYSHDARGLAECYAAALPFFKFTLAGDLVWAAVLFGSYGLARLTIKHRAVWHQAFQHAIG